MSDIFKQCLSDIADMQRGASLAFQQPEQTIAALNRRILRLEADLHECLEYFKDRYDVVDGDYGEQVANKEMRLGMMLDETLNGRDF